MKEKEQIVNEVKVLFLGQGQDKPLPWGLTYTDFMYQVNQ